MWVRFLCPACKQTHQLDMPETTIHLTCSQSNRVLQMKLGVGGDVRAKVLNPDGTLDQSGEAEEE